MSPGQGRHGWFSHCYKGCDHSRGGWCRCRLRHSGGKDKFFAKDLPDNLDKLRAGIERRIPLGAGAGNKKLTHTAIERVRELKSIATQEYEKVDKHWITALGSLGSGNHFIEICLDENDQVWVALLSGSRGIGNRLATKHIKIAQKLMDEESIQLKGRDLAYLNRSYSGV